MNHILDDDVIFAVEFVGHLSVSYITFVAVLDVIRGLVPYSDWSVHCIDSDWSVYRLGILSLVELHIPIHLLSESNSCLLIG